MAQAPGGTLLAAARGFNQLSNTRKIALIAGLGALIALVVVLGAYTRAPTYRVLFSNLSDRDGGAILGALSQMNVPYKMAEGGGAILVPSEVVYDTRLKLASQGLPRGGGVGFELMENQRFGTSQFAEQVNYQRALEGELGRTIQSLAAVQGARVHLAIPRPSVFLREGQKPSASVMVGMLSGRVLDPGQVNGIVHLVASSVPELLPRNVTVVDQAGNLLTGPPGETRNGALDAAQLKYLHQVEAAIAARVENIIKPITGPENVRAQVAAMLDFSEVEQTSEIYKPNSSPQDQAVRSQQSSESNSTTPQQQPQGVPGALSNTPPGAASAPLSTPQAGAAAGQQGGQQQATPPATTSQREQTVNYEVDKTIRHTKGEIGAIKRLSVAVVVNYRRAAGQDAKPEPLSEQEIAQITDLAREAMGFSRERGDTLNVVNAAFREAGESTAALPVWKDPAYISLGVDVLKVLVVLVAGFLVLRMVLSVVRDLAKLGRPELAGAAAGATGEGTVYGPGGQPSPGAAEAGPDKVYESDLRAARELARQDPRVVAQVVKDWVGRE